MNLYVSVDELAKHYYQINQWSSGQEAIEKAIENASRMIDSYIAGKVSTPLSICPPALHAYVIDIAVYNLLIATGLDDSLSQDSSIQKKYKDAIEYLRLLATGKINIVTMLNNSSSILPDNSSTSINIKEQNLLNKSVHVVQKSSKKWDISGNTDSLRFGDKL